MNKIIIVAIVSLVVAGGILFAALWGLTPEPAIDRPNTSTTNPPSSTAGGTSQTTSSGTTNIDTPATGGTQGVVVPVSSSQGGTVSVQDFRDDSGVVTSPNIPGHYFIAGGLNPNDTGASFSTFYVDSDQSFTISLLAEPIGEVRKQAEQNLLQHLGISQSDACNLRYQVLVPYRVNSFYSGKNLGFSFCSGATPL